jgi:hypothetical protein
MNKQGCHFAEWHNRATLQVSGKIAPVPTVVSGPAYRKGKNMNNAKKSDGLADEG